MIKSYVPHEGATGPVTPEELKLSREVSLRGFLDARRQGDPLALACMPRRVVTSDSRYANPAAYCTGMWLASTYITPERLMRDEVCKNNMLLHEQLRSAQVPIWFLDAEFSRAVMRTKPTVDLKGSDLRMPLPAMLWVLDREFSKSVFGWQVPFIGVARQPAGRTQLMVGGGWHRQPVLVQQDMLVINFTRQSDNGAWEEYSQARSMDMPISQCLVGNLEHYDSGGPESEWLPLKIDNISPVDDESLFRKVMSFIFQMILVMNTRPDSFMTPGECTRKAKARRGMVLQDELWSPHVIGRGYQAKRVDGARGEPGGGTVRMHWRRGHLHTVKFGKGRESSRLDWFEPVLVNAPEGKEVSV